MPYQEMGQNLALGTREDGTHKIERRGERWKNLSNLQLEISEYWSLIRFGMMVQTVTIMAKE